MDLKDKNLYVEKTHFHFAIFITFLLCATLFLIGYIKTNRKIDTLPIENDEKNETNEVFGPSEETVIYKVMTYNDKIGVFKNNTFLYSINVYVFTLPEEDKKLLAEGIIALNEEELYEILEEYY